MSVTPLPHRPRPPEHQQEKRTRKRREREKIAVEKGNENVLDNWFVIVFVCAIHLSLCKLNRAQVLLLAKATPEPQVVAPQPSGLWSKSLTCVKRISPPWWRWMRSQTT